MSQLSEAVGYEAISVRPAYVGVARIEAHIMVSGPPGIGKKVTHFVLTILVATVFGPLIGGAGAYLVWAMWTGLPGSAVAEPRALLTIVTFGYLLGGFVALVAGTLVAVVALWRRPTFPIIIAATVVACLGYEAAIGWVQQDRLLINLAASAFAATICWLLFRRLLRNP